MKRLITFFIFVLCLSITLKAQSKFVEINCNYPGWLSSYLTPDVATTLTDLKVTGCINDADLKTIGNLIKNYNLNGKLDLSDVSIAGELEDSIAGDMFGQTECRLRTISLPKNLKAMSNVINWVTLDTLEVGSKYIPDFAFIFLGEAYDKMNVRHLVLREGSSILRRPKPKPTTSGRIPRPRPDLDGECSSLVTITLPDTLKEISFNAAKFPNLEFINTPSEVEFLCSMQGTKFYHNVEIYKVPSKCKCFNTKWINDGYVGDGGIVKELFLPETLDSLANTNGEVAITIHSKAKFPPKVYAPYNLSKCIVYVPSGYEEAYKNSGWKYATVIGEKYAESIVLQNKKQSIKIGEELQLTANVFPADAVNNNIMWLSEDTTIVKIDKGGVITGLKNGTTKIYAKLEDDINICDYAIIDVVQPVTGITLNYTEYMLGQIGETCVLEAKILPENASNQNVVWRSSNENVCFVNNGFVIALNYGISVILATTEDGNYIASCIIQVQDNTNSIEEISNQSEDLLEGIYDINGVKLSELKKGVNLIIYKNGIIKKLYVE